ncbi:hypothetical protein [uncultured Fibrobacter sp.]|uniref:hypothetical protein n=1 Tax=uncultured Fibrobacter sp. TaxID=261512 RepID=UPI00259238D0|nr:hypothetical protein [uncultured Fibrobacter sp.]
MQEPHEPWRRMLVPINQQGLEIDMLQMGDPCTGNFKEWAITTEEMNSIINSILFDYCKRFNVYIDSSEDCVLGKECIAEALEMAKEFLQKCSTRFFQKRSKKEVLKRAVPKLIEALEFAKSTDMPIWFWF